LKHRTFLRLRCEAPQLSRLNARDLRRLRRNLGKFCDGVQNRFLHFIADWQAGESVLKHLNGCPDF
jgi:hypothetical protein